MNNPTIPQNTPTGQSEARQHAARAEFEPYRLKPRYDCNRSGVFYIGVKTDKDGETNRARHRRNRQSLSNYRMAR